MTDFQALNIAVLTVSDTRTEDTDSSGRTLVDALTAAGHTLAHKAIVKDDIYQIRAACSAWIAESSVNVILITGGTGFAGRDSTPEAVAPLLDKEVVGFGELFRQVSYRDIGSSTMQSRALAGLANFTVIFCLPGSNNACKTGWQLIAEQLDARHKPCNFVALLNEKGRQL
jgi:molybdopterin adenylyltransferase